MCRSHQGRPRSSRASATATSVERHRIIVRTSGCRVDRYSRRASCARLMAIDCAPCSMTPSGVDEVAARRPHRAQFRGVAVVPMGREGGTERDYRAFVSRRAAVGTVWCWIGGRRRHNRARGFRCGACRGRASRQPGRSQSGDVVEDSTTSASTKIKYFFALRASDRPRCCLCANVAIGYRACTRITVPLSRSNARTVLDFPRGFASDSVRSLARRFAGALRPRGSLFLKPPWRLPRIDSRRSAPAAQPLR